MKYNYHFDNVIKLSDEELMEEFKKLKETGDKSIRDKLISATILLVPSTIESYFPLSPYEKEDLISIGTLGLIHAIDEYDLNKGIKFSTFATKCILGKIHVYHRRAKHHLNLAHLEDTIYKGNGDMPKTYIDNLADDENHEDNLNNKLDNELTIKRLLRLIKKSPQNQQAVLITKYFSGETPLSDEEVAKRVGHSKQNVAGVKARAIKKLKAKMQPYLN